MQVSVLDFFSNPAEVIECGQLCDRLGCFQRFWIGEHHAGDQVPDPLLVAMLIAGTTDSIRLGTGAISLTFRNPYVIAETGILAEYLFPDRIDLGVTKSLAVASEIHAYLTDGLDYQRVVDTFAGRVETLRKLLLRIEPGREAFLAGTVTRGPPMYLMATNTLRAEQAGRWGIGLVGSFHHGGSVESIRRMVDAYRGCFQPSPMFSQPYAIAVISGFVSGDPDQVARVREIDARVAHDYKIRQGRSLEGVTVFDLPEPGLQQIASLREAVGADEMMFLPLLGEPARDCCRGLAAALGVVDP